MTGMITDNFLTSSVTFVLQNQKLTNLPTNINEATILPL